MRKIVNITVTLEVEARDLNILNQGVHDLDFHFLSQTEGFLILDYNITDIDVDDNEDLSTRNNLERSRRDGDWE
jgi:hypothetical protein